MPDEERDRFIQGYRWCPRSETIQAWEEGQDFGCIWCPKDGLDQPHAKLVLAAYADAAWEATERIRSFLATIRNAEIGEPEEVVAQMVAHYRAACRSRTYPGQLTNLIKGLAVVGVRAIANGRWANLEHRQAVALKDALVTLIDFVQERIHPSVDPGLPEVLAAATAVVEAAKLEEDPDSPVALDLDNLPRPDPDPPPPADQTEVAP